MNKAIAGLAAAFAVVAAAGPAYGHVTVQPTEATIGSFSRFVVRVPTEEVDAATIRVRLELPPLAFVSFEPAPGWKRTITTGAFDEPVEAFGEEIAEGVTSVTWSGGKIEPSEFFEFGFSAKMPDEETTLTFRAVQSYDSGKVVRWVGDPDSDEPAPTLTTYDIGAEEGQGELAVLARVNDTLETTKDDSEDAGASVSVGVGAAALLVGLAALVVALRGARA